MYWLTREQNLVTYYYVKISSLKQCVILFSGKETIDVATRPSAFPLLTSRLKKLTPLQFTSIFEKQLDGSGDMVSKQTIAVVMVEKKTELHKNALQRKRSS